MSTANSQQLTANLHIITPYSFNRKLFESYDQAFDLIPENHWVCFLDGDTAFLRSDFGHIMADYIAKHPKTGLFTSYASRCFYSHQVPQGTDQQNPSIKYHKEIADNLAKSHPATETILKPIAGHLLLIKKETWLSIRQNVHNRCKHESIEGVDTAISKEIIATGRIILLMKSIYILHYYRLLEGTTNRKHLGYGMKLNIITPCVRPENLALIADSINIPTTSLKWYVVFDNIPANINPNLIPQRATPLFHQNPKSIVGHAQRNFALDKITDGYVLFLDDDTLLHPNLYDEIIELDNDFIHFDQANPDGSKRIGGTVKVNHIDTGSAVVHRALIGNTRFQINLYNADGIFWEQIAKKAKSPFYIPKSLSYYNLLTTPSTNQQINKSTQPVTSTQQPATSNKHPAPRNKKPATSNQQQETDIVFPLGTGSKWSNNEIRFAIRTIYKNLKGFRNIYIIGEDPGFLHGPNLFIIPFTDPYNPNKNADGNIITKVLRACLEPNLSDNFLFINDDNYIIKPMHVNDIYPFHKGNMNDIDPNTFDKSIWGRRLGRTRMHLLNHGQQPLHFDHHAPIMFNKALFQEIVKQYDYSGDIGLTIKSLYGSHVYPDAPVMKGEKVAIFKPSKFAEINTFLKSALFAASNDPGLNDSFKYWLYTNFPDPSPLETTFPSDKILAVAKWVASGKDYDEGVQLYSQHIPFKANLKRLFTHNKSSLLTKKLNYYLTQILNEL
jgi:hypothetical protein